jgi:hypothetical protein
VSTGGDRGHGGGRAGVDRWAAGRKVLRAADPRMAALVDADPGLDPEAWMDRVPSDLWGALETRSLPQATHTRSRACTSGDPHLAHLPTQRGSGAATYRAFQCRQSPHTAHAVATLPSAGRRAR